MSADIDNFKKRASRDKMLEILERGWMRGSVLRPAEVIGHQLIQIQRRLAR